MRIMVFLHGTVIMHRNAAGRPREERIRQVHDGDESLYDFASYVPVDNAVAKLQGWKQQGAEILYLSFHTRTEDIEVDKAVLRKHCFPDGQVFFRQDGEQYKNVAERVLPDILIEDNCESIGGEAEMTYPHIKPELEARIKSIIVREFGGIDYLPDQLSRLRSYDRGFEGVLPEQVERLSTFRSEHPCKRVTVAGVEWEYISCGDGTKTLLLLTGGLRVAESAFSYIQMFEDSYRVIAPTYPPLRTMGELVDGVVAILDAEQVPEAFVLGQSYGGAVAQVLIQGYPSRVRKVVLSGTAPLIAVRWKELLNDLLLAIATLLPERVVLSLFKRILSPLITVQESERAFWEGYLRELFGQRLTKADVLSHLQTTRDVLTNYVYTGGAKSSWCGDVLIVWGENDHLRTERGRKGMLEIYPQAQIHVIAGGGHTVAMSEPAKYAAAVRGFLEKG